MLRPTAAACSHLQWFVLSTGAQGPGGFAESHILWDHLHAGEEPPDRVEGTVEPQGRAQLCPALCLQLTCLPQSPSVDAPLRLVLQVSAPPRCTIKPSGTSVSVSAFLNISLVPPDRPPVQLSSMAMVRGRAGATCAVTPVHTGAVSPILCYKALVSPSRGTLGLWDERSSWPGCPLPAVSQPSLPPQETKLSAKVFLQGKALRVQLDLRRYGWGPMGAWGESPPHPTHNCFLLSRFRIYSKQSALESLAVRV